MSKPDAIPNPVPGPEPAPTPSNPSFKTIEGLSEDNKKSFLNIIKVLAGLGILGVVLWAWFRPEWLVTIVVAVVVAIFALYGLKLVGEGTRDFVVSGEFMNRLCHHIDEVRVERAQQPAPTSDTF